MRQFTLREKITGGGSYSFPARRLLFRQLLSRGAGVQGCRGAGEKKWHRSSDSGKGVGVRSWEAQRREVISPSSPGW
ncbi:hypothetical protein JYQ62_19160 [Nostoc sp. UHCC 0702]|nr:hypothetical protein JYQ62_19160 [Nostoc sp. UHCC 0702]